MMMNNAWISVSPVELLVQRSCEPSLAEPPYAVHLELAEHINNKKANTPREAAMAAVRLVNHRNPHVSVLALALINTLVEQCGYPFHLQIATKEFLNELVRRFPERPPPFPGPVMQRILDMIHAWREGLCNESRWKEDLGNIRDMHRLLSFKGYRFRADNRQHTAAAASSGLKSPDELEAEDRDAQSAKLQELIRRGTPRDLAAAQELMKIMAGANPEQKPDYRSQTMAELNKLEQKVVLLSEMLDNVDTQRGERFTSGDVYDQVASVIKEARPKIQKWISDAESDDPESLDTFLQMNDKINNALNRYELYKKGDYAAAANPIPAELSQPPPKSDLIDFDFDSSPSSGPTAGGSNNAQESLLELFASPAPANGGGSIALPQTQFAPNQMAYGPFGGQQQQQFPGMGMQGYPQYQQPQQHMMQQPQMQHPTPAQFGGMMQPQQQQQQQQPGMFAQGGQQAPPRPMQFGAIMLPGTPKPASPPTGTAPAGSSVPMTMGAAAPAAPQQQQQAQGKDPFADLAGLF